MGRVLRIALVSVFALGLLVAPVQAGNVPPVAKVERAEDFRLFDHLGGSHGLSHYFNRKAVVLVSVNTQDAGSLDQIKAADKLGASVSNDEVAFLFINGEQGIERETVAAFAREAGITLPILVDTAQLVLRTLGITHGAEALLIDTSDWSIAYRGAVVGADGAPLLKSALEAHLQGGAIETAHTEAAGAPYDVAAPDENVSYSKDIAPLIAEKCGICHRPDDIGPFSFSSFAVTKNYAPMIREVVMTRRMPPWHSDPHFQTYNHELALTDSEKRMLIDWIDLGALRGEGPDPLAALVEPRETKWELGEPDAVVAMSEAVELPAQGVFDYKYFRETVDFGGEDRWVEAIEVLPGNRAVLHHSLIFLQYPDDMAHLKPDDFGGVGGYFAAWGPGYLTLPFPEGTAKFVPDGSTIIFQMHYTATGKPETDLTKLGIHYADEEPKMEFVTRAASNLFIELPPNQEDIEFKGTYYFRDPVYIYGLAPHMHLRGSRFSYVAEFPDGRQQTLLNVPYFDFNWQREYRLPEPLKLPAGSLLRCTGAYNNSVTNPNNPDPTDRVDWGNQSWDEMFIGHFTFAREDKVDPTAPRKERALADGLGERITEENIVGTEWAIDMDIIQKMTGRGGGDRDRGRDDDDEARDGDRDRDADDDENRPRRRRSMLGNIEASIVFAPGGVAVIAEVLSADYRISGSYLTIDLRERQVMLNIKDDKLAFLGVSLKRVVPEGDEAIQLSGLRSGE